MEIAEDTPEMIAKEKKREYMREYMRKYQKNRMEKDPDYAERHREYVRQSINIKWHNDEEYREKKKEADRTRYNKYKSAYNTLKSQKPADL